MVLTGESRKTREQNLSQCHFVHHKTHLDGPGIDSELRGQQLNAWARTRFIDFS